MQRLGECAAHRSIRSREAGRAAPAAWRVRRRSTDCAKRSRRRPGHGELVLNACRGRSTGVGRHGADRHELCESRQCARADGVGDGADPRGRPRTTRRHDRVPGLRRTPALHGGPRRRGGRSRRGPGGVVRPDRGGPGRARRAEPGSGIAARPARPRCGLGAGFRAAGVRARVLRVAGRAASAAGVPRGPAGRGAAAVRRSPRAIRHDTAARRGPARDHPTRPGTVHYGPGRHRTDGPGPVRSGGFGYACVRFGPVRSGRFGYARVRFGPVRLGRFRCGHIWPGSVWPGRAQLAAVRPYAARSRGVRFCLARQAVVRPPFF